MEGFDDIYSDIVDYIVRCTHRIWDERDIGLIYTHYTHNCVVYRASDTLYDREQVVRDTIARLVVLPERRGMATQVIWNGNDQDGFYTSHLVTGSGRHTQPGQYGPPTGRNFHTRTIADCLIFQNRIYREYLVSDGMATIKQLGLDPRTYATDMARGYFDKGMLALDIAESGRLEGQYPPDSEADLGIANNDFEREVLKWLHVMYNQRMFGRIRDLYAPTVQHHGPLTVELFGIEAVMQQTLGLIGSMPDASFIPQHICSNPCDEGGTKVAVRWILQGHHLGWGLLHELGAPTGKHILLHGMSHYHFKDGRIIDEWVVYDQMSALMQVKLAQMADKRSVQELDSD
jgi:predicted ester cyclase